MRHLPIWFALNLVCTPALVAQDASHEHDADAHAQAVPQSYIVQLTEVRMPSISDAALTADDIAKSLNQAGKDGHSELVEMVRISALEGHESMAQFGKSTSVTTGTTTMPGPMRTQARQTQQQMTGTMVRLTAVPQGDKVLLKLSYEASRLEGEGRDDGPPDTVRAQFSTTLLVKPGESKLVAGTSAGESTLLLVRVIK